MSGALVADLEAMLATIPVVDCHEHTFLPAARPARVDMAALFAGSDVADDLISAGMPAAERPALTWATVEPYLDRVANTGFYRSLAAAFAALFGYDGERLTEADWEALSARLAAANARDDWYDTVLRDSARIETVLRIQGGEPDPWAIPRRWFRAIARVDDWIVGAADRGTRERLAAEVGAAAGTLEAYLTALDAWFDDLVRHEVVGIKSMLAYRRPLAHGRPDAAEAARLYGLPVRTPAETAALEDALVHAVAERAGASGLPWQIHVGIGSWQSNIVANADPLMLNPLVEAHRGTTFVLLHGGYPYIGEVATMAKNHPNVVIECGWLAYIAPSVHRRALGEWLDAVPASKILAVGADCAYVEQTLGALILTRHQLALVLADRIRDSGWTPGLAESVARRLLGSNGRDLYRLAGDPEGGGRAR
ncbi:MAG: amidohydrolase family protein [Chloroflexota bacterium]